MEIAEAVIVFFIALFVASLFFYGLRRRGPWGAFWVFLLILILAAWVGRLWITPAGPLIWGYGWLPVLFWVFMIALLIGIASPGEDDRRVDGDETIDYEPETKTRLSRDERGVAAVFGIFFWMLLLLFAVAIIVGLMT